MCKKFSAAQTPSRIQHRTSNSGPGVESIPSEATISFR
jgi:hypothetical protein